MLHYASLLKFRSVLPHLSRDSSSYKLSEYDRPVGEFNFKSTSATAALAAMMFCTIGEGHIVGPQQ
jgi:hypothetical protein